VTSMAIFSSPSEPKKQYAELRMSILISAMAANKLEIDPAE